MPTAARKSTTSKATPEQASPPPSKYANGLEALAALQGELPIVRRATEGQVGTRPYRYADLSDVWDAVQPLLAKHGFVYVVAPQQAERGEHYEVVGALVHVPTCERFIAVLPLTGGTAPQQLGAALTYARRYLLACLTGLITDDDPDAHGTTAARPQGTTATPPAKDPYLAAQEALEAEWSRAWKWDLKTVASYYTQIMGGDLMEAKTEQLEKFREKVHEAVESALAPKDEAQQGGDQK